ncbi:hypothetical protein KC356_g295 [Hortaea werneckii]|nr:hypothetical protein KC356_g295 [Hortaea werneckii]
MKTDAKEYLPKPGTEKISFQLLHLLLRLVKLDLHLRHLILSPSSDTGTPEVFSIVAMKDAKAFRSSCILLELLLERNNLIFEAVDLVVGVCEAFLIASEQMIVTIHDDPCQCAGSWVRKAKNIMAPPVFSVASLARTSFRIQKIKSKRLACWIGRPMD